MLYWRRLGAMDWRTIQPAVDRPDALWINGYHSYNGRNDRIPEDRTSGLSGSLLLIKPTNLILGSIS